MKCTERLLSILAAIALLTAACSSSPDEQANNGPTPGANAPTPVASVAEVDPTPLPPTPTPEPAPLTEAEKITAATSAFGASPQPENLTTWDHLSARVSGDNVRLELCGWTGETVFDDVYTVAYTVTPTVDGPPSVRFVSTNTTIDECLSSGLVESIIDAANGYETYWSSVLEDPTTFDPAEAAQYKTPRLVEDNIERVGGWVRDGVHWVGHGFDADIPEGSTVELLYRRFQGDDQDVFEIITCRQMRPGHGLYRGDVLFQDFAPETPAGFERLHAYQFVRIEGGWLLDSVISNGYANCGAFTPNWLEGVNGLMPDPTPWQLVPGV